VGEGSPNFEVGAGALSPTPVSVTMLINFCLLRMNTRIIGCSVPSAVATPMFIMTG